jgi:hypothetical protein
LKSPKKAAEEMNITLTRSEVDYIKSLDPDQVNSIAAEVQVMTRTESGAMRWA